jgi:hypothetical protein
MPTPSSFLGNSSGSARRLGKIVFLLACFAVAVVAYLLFRPSDPETLETLLRPEGGAGEAVLQDLLSRPTFVLSSETDRDGTGKDVRSFVVKDEAAEGVRIQYADQKQPDQGGVGRTVSLPEDPSRPFRIDLGQGRAIGIKDAQADARSEAVPLKPRDSRDSSYLLYRSKGSRKESYYAYFPNPAGGELKHWTLYRKGSGKERERYEFENAALRKNEDGSVSVFYRDSQKEAQTAQTLAQVDQSLLDRAQRTLEREAGQNPFASTDQRPDLTVPAPFFVDKDGVRHNAEWRVGMDGTTLEISFEASPEDYPLALDPTLLFTAPGQSNTYSSISQEGTAYFGYSLAAGDFDADGDADLAVGAYRYNSYTGRVYIFHNDGAYPSSASTADVTITGGAANGYFGQTLAAGDFDADGDADLAVGAPGYSSSTGRAYLFYNDGAYPSSAASADVAITGEAASDQFGYALAAGDFDNDGDTDLAVGAPGYSSSTGRAYLFYNDGSIPTAASSADVIITGVANPSFGKKLAAGDFNFDGSIDLTVGGGSRAYLFYNDGAYPSSAASADVTIVMSWGIAAFGVGDFNYDGRTDLAVGDGHPTGHVYLFYNDGSIPTTDSTADKTISSPSYNTRFGESLAAGDFNSDGRIDLAAGTYGFDSVQVFLNDGAYPSSPSNADIAVYGETLIGSFGYALAAGDFNSDGRIDLAAGAYNYKSETGRTYIFYNDGSIPSSASSADVAITGEAAGDQFGYALAAGDFDHDGDTDLAVGAPGYSSSTGRAYLFYNDGAIPTTAATADVAITGQSSADAFGSAFAAGDFNYDGRVDLAVGAYGYSGGTGTGRAYLFYSDGSYPTVASSADVAITGATSTYFGTALAAGDFNYDGRTDLAVGAPQYSAATGRTYLFYNDGSIPTAASSADVTITGPTTNSYFGNVLAVGDFNNDGRTDLAVGAYGYSSNTGRAYIFYNDGAYPSSAASADVSIGGSATYDQFGASLTAGDFNADGRMDLAISAGNSKAYIFYNDGSIPTTAATADVIASIQYTISFSAFVGGPPLVAGDFNYDGKTDIVVGMAGTASLLPDGRVFILYSQNGQVNLNQNITGEGTTNYFGVSLAAGDFDGDGDEDLAVGASLYGSNAGRVYLFYNDGSYPTSATGADVTIAGETTSAFGWSLAVGDFDGDNDDDFAVGSNLYGSSAGRASIFYSDGSYPASAASADVDIAGESGSRFGTSMVAGDFNSDGGDDLAVGAIAYSTGLYTGRAYVFYNDGSTPTAATSADVTITGESSANQFGYSMKTGDFDNDGDDDVVIGAHNYGSNQGRAYLFYNDGSYPTTAATADVIISGETTSTKFGEAFAVGDLNGDGLVDLAVGANTYSGDTGRVYFYVGRSGTPPSSVRPATIRGMVKTRGTVKIR